jgi:hypothetical protein
MEGSKYIYHHNQTNIINIGNLHIWIISLRRVHPQDVVVTPLQVL